MPSRTPPAPSASAWETIFSASAGIWLALALLKFGNPVILDRNIPGPSTWEELLIGPWPMGWGHVLFGLVALSSIRLWRMQTQVPMWLLVLPAVWTAWQITAATQTIDRELTLATLKHFVVCAGAFYVGVFAFSRVSRPEIFWLALIGAFVVVMLTGWRQHFGGLEETRRFLYSLPEWEKLPPEFLKKLSSDRIYATLFYPNTLAGVVLLLLPVIVAQVWNAVSFPQLKTVLCGGAAVLGLGCLYWSGSKAGWLIALVQGTVALLYSKLGRPLKVATVVVILLLGLLAFWVKHQSYFDRGATSVSARFDYWQAAWQTLKSNPVLGTGPGTFMVSYRALKPPEAEMARLAHNDFLQQGSDSGWLGLLAFTGFLVGSLILLYPNSSHPQHQTRLWIWLGLLGASLQSTVEFGLYIPAFAWPLFFLTGSFLGASQPRNQIDKPRVNS